MRIFIYVPDTLYPILRDQALAAHRPVRYQLEWIVEQALRAASPTAPQPSPPSHTAPLLASQVAENPISA